MQQTPGVEFGVKGGAAINVVLKSGTNAFHGTAQGFYSSDKFAEKNYFTKLAGGDKSPLSNKQFGATFGGPLIKDKTHFFGFYEAQRLTVSTPYRAFVPTPNQITEARGRIAAAGLLDKPGGREPARVLSHRTRPERSRSQRLASPAPTSCS